MTKESLVPIKLPADPVNPLEAATKQYVDAVAQGLNAKQSVRLASDVSIGGGSAPGTNLPVDGVATVGGDRVLLKNQSNPQYNGIYTVNAVSTWNRAPDANTWSELVSSFTFVEEGTTNADTGWLCTANQGGTLGTTAITWTQFSGLSGGSGMDQATADGRYVNVSGDTMTGTLNMPHDSPVYYGADARISGDYGTLRLWSRANGITANQPIDGQTPTAATHLTTKAYVDSAVGTATVMDTYHGPATAAVVTSGVIQDIPGTTLNVVSTGPNDKFLAIATADVCQTGSNGQALVIQLSTDGGVQGGQVISTMPNMPSVRNTIGQHWIITGLAAGNHSFKLQVGGITVGSWTVYNSHTKLTVVRLASQGPQGPMGPSGPTAPIGTISMWGGASAPASYLICNGGIFSSTAYPDLAAVLGDTYGTHSGTNYYLPDFRGRNPIGVGAVSPDQGSGYIFNLGQKWGLEQTALQGTHLPKHAHGAPGSLAGGGGSGDRFYRGSPSADTNFRTDTGIYPNAGYGSAEVGAQIPLPMHNPVLGVNYIIKALADVAILPGGGAANQSGGAVLNGQGGFPLAIPGATTGVAVTLPAGVLRGMVSATGYVPGAVSRLAVVPYIDGVLLDTTSYGIMALELSNAAAGAHTTLPSMSFQMNIAAGTHYCYIRQINGTSDSGDKYSWMLNVTPN